VNIGGRVAVGAGASAAAVRRPGRFRRYLLRSAVVVVVVLIGVGAGLQWSRPVPSPTFDPGQTDSVHLAGRSPTLPWPTSGSAALTMLGVGSLGRVGSTTPVPIASITKVMTAYVVLTDHPLSIGETGPVIPVDAPTLAAYDAGETSQQSEVKVVAGETLTELQALEGLLIPSGNDIATMLADWDAGSTTAFVAKMNSTAQSLGLHSTHFVDVSGLDPGSVSNATDLIQLGQAAMGLPAFAQVTAMGEVTLPEAGLVYNFDYDIGHGGIIGIKTGTDSAAGGCFLFEAQQTVDGKKVTLVGAVLGQRTSSPITAVLAAAESLSRAAFQAIGPSRLVSPAQIVGHIVAPWGASVTVGVPASPSVVGWPGLALHSQLHVGALPRVVDRGTRIGVLTVDVSGRDVDVAVRAASHLSGPSVLWRLTR
jgi:D-alanyl-D-alanine carboxypeptidase (penicillin-binding protein 5/6)